MNDASLPVPVAAFNLRLSSSKSVQLSWQLTATDGMQDIVLERKADSHCFGMLKTLQVAAVLR